MYDDIWELLNTCQNLLTVCQKLIIAERNLNKEAERELREKLAEYTANKALAGILKND